MEFERIKISIKIPDFIGRNLPQKFYWQTMTVILICLTELIVYTCTTRLNQYQFTNNQTSCTNCTNHLINDNFSYWTLLTIMLITQCYWIFQTQQFASAGYVRLSWILGPFLPFILVMSMFLRLKKETTRMATLSN